jgi:hypothetical protein
MPPKLCGFFCLSSSSSLKHTSPLVSGLALDASVSGLEALADEGSLVSRLPSSKGDSRHFLE